MFLYCLQGCHFTLKNMEFDNLGEKNLEILTIFSCSVVKFRFETKILLNR